MTRYGISSWRLYRMEFAPIVLARSFRSHCPTVGPTVGPYILSDKEKTPNRLQTITIFLPRQPSEHLTLEQCWNIVEIRSWHCSKLNFDVGSTYSARREVLKLADFTSSGAPNRRAKGRWIFLRQFFGSSYRLLTNFCYLYFFFRSPYQVLTVYVVILPV